MSGLPFTVYDTLAYLFSGGVIVAAADMSFGQQWLLQPQPSAALLVLLLFLAYLTGHVVAEIASNVYEHLVIGHLLGRPSSVLLGSTRRPRLLSAVLAGYYRPLPPETVARLRSKLAADDAASADLSGEPLFLKVFARLSRDAAVKARLDTFLNLYGFARNVSFALIVAAIVLAVGRSVHARPASTWPALIAALLGVGLFFRFLKFYRHYSATLLSLYAEDKE